jgi:hypothetical protein
MTEPNQGPASPQPAGELTAALDAQHVQTLKQGANWFYWIAALSAINSIIMLAHGEWAFIVGLGITQFVDGFAYALAEESPELESTAMALAIGVNLVVVGTCALFGFLANRRMAWAFWVGMALYGSDGLLLLAFGDYLSFAFHLFALWGISAGLRALRAIKAPA